MKQYDFADHFDKLDHEEEYTHIRNTPWFQDAVYELFPAEEFARRRARLQQAMAQRGFDCLIVAGGQSHWSQGAGLTWATGLIDTRSMAQYAIFPREGEPVLFYAMGGSHAEQVRRTVSVREVLIPSRGQYARAMVEWITAHGLERGRIGVLEAIPGEVPEYPPQAQMETLLAALPEAAIELVAGLFHELACIKSDAELEAFARAGALAARAYQALAARARPGATEHHLVAAAASTILAGGGRPDAIRVGSTPSHAPALPAPNPLPSSRVLQAGDLILAEVSAGFMGVTACVGGPICLGAPAPEVRALWQEILLPGYLALEACLQPGTPLEAVRTAGRYFREHSHQTAPLLLHGLDVAASGPWVYADEVVAEPYEQALRPGMVVVLRPNALAADGAWGLAVTRTYAITPEGARCLTSHPLELDVV